MNPELIESNGLNEKIDSRNGVKEIDQTEETKKEILKCLPRSYSPDTMSSSGLQPRICSRTGIIF